MPFLSSFSKSSASGSHLKALVVRNALSNTLFVELLKGSLSQGWSHVWLSGRREQHTGQGGSLAHMKGGFSPAG